MVLLLLITAATSFITCRSHSLYLDTLKRRTAAIFVSILFVTALSFFINFRIGTLISHDNLPVKLSGFIARIEHVEKKRYNSDLYFTYEVRPGFQVKGILTYSGTSEIRPGSIIAVHKPVSRTDVNENGYLLRLKRQGVNFRGTVDDTEISIMDRGRETFRRSLQESAIKKITDVFPRPVSALLVAIYFGDTSYLEKKIITHFRDAGTLHLLAASGMNIALVASIPLLLLVPAGIGKRKSVFISAAVTAFYLLITDMPVSLVRAAAMYMFMTAAIFLSREKNPFNSLYLAGSLIILLQPWELFNPGFQLSFGATAGILFFYKKYRESMKNFPSMIGRSLAVTFAAQLAAYPLIYLHLEQFNPAGFITNLMEIPLITIITLFSLAILGVSFLFPVIAQLLTPALSLLCKCVFNLNDFASSMKLNFFPDDALIPAVVIILSVLPLISHSFFTRMKAWPVFTALLLSAMLLSFQRHAASTGNMPLEQSRGIRIEKEKDHLKLILSLDDTADFNEDMVFLLRKINPDIKIIEISHTTYNNITACRLLMNDFTIEECIVNNVKSIDSGFTGFLKILQKENIKVTIRQNERS